VGYRVIRRFVFCASRVQQGMHMLHIYNGLSVGRLEYRHACETSSPHTPQLFTAAFASRIRIDWTCAVGE
jgi:hypothetical protein